MAPFHVLLTSSILVPRFLAFEKLMRSIVFSRSKFSGYSVGTAPHRISCFLVGRNIQMSFFGNEIKKKKFRMNFQTAIAAHGSDTYRQM